MPGKHWKRKTPLTSEYMAWAGTKARCYNPRNKNYRTYGARGITVCDRWRHNYANFLADMGKRPSPSHTLDRIDNDGNYTPENCRWAANKEQARRRLTSHVITINGRSQCISAWCEEIGISHTTVTKRIMRGWSEESAILEPIRFVPLWHK